MDFPAKAKEFGQRLLQQQVRIGITGLSGAGKTAFITSLIHFLTQGANSQSAFFDVMQQGRFIGGSLQPNANLQLARFPFEFNLQQIQQGRWPASTEQLSQLTLELRYHSRQLLRSRLGHYQSIWLEITDYPGEWLLDLPMLSMDFAHWTAQAYAGLAANQQLPAVAAYLIALHRDQQTNDALRRRELTDLYQQALLAMKQQGLLALQPGRLLRPAELAGSPLLELFPLQPTVSDGPLYGYLHQQFKAYCQQVITPFYQRYFAGLDRQIILVDCLGALNSGFAALQQLQQALLRLSEQFRYGPDSWFGRLFKPRISKVLFAASKADLLTPDQHRNLLLLLQQMLRQPLYQQQYQLCQTEVLAIASVASARLGQAQTSSGLQPCLQGRLQQNAELCTLYPGDVPLSMPSEAIFAQHRFEFPRFLPMLDANQQISHIRLDQALQFLLGDLLQ